MGAYKPEQICKDFDITMKGITHPVIEDMKIIALKMLKTLPDNQARDMAFSHLLETADFIKFSILKETSNELDKRNTE